MSKKKRNKNKSKSQKNLTQAEIDANWYKNVKILKPYGKPSISRKRIREAVRAVMDEGREINPKAVF